MPVPPEAGDAEASRLRDPWVWVVAALAASLVALLFSSGLTGSLAVVRLLLLAPAVAAAGAAVLLRPKSPWVVGWASVAALFASFGAYDQRAQAGWDSAGLLLWVVALFGGVCAVLLALPRPWRRAGVSVLILAHFVGILSAVTNIAPAPWWSNQIWTRVYRPYLQFMYLNNAYHYYSPDPGPPDLLWFYVEYEDTKDADGNTVENWRWVRVPDLDAATGQPLRPDGRPLRPYVQYSRRLSLAQNVNNMDAVPVTRERLARREAAGRIKDIPLPPLVEPGMQFRVPVPLAQKFLEAFARFAARHFKHQEHPELAVRRVKIYRVTHRILGPRELSEGIPPDDPTLYFPFYQGTYWPNGLRTDVYTEDGKLRLMPREDPFLWWYIPRFYEPKEHAPHADHPPPPNLLASDQIRREELKNLRLKDCLLTHARMRDEDESEGNN